MKLSIITATHHRPNLLASCAAPSILTQLDHCFEWVVVNDGQDIPTRQIVNQLQTDIKIRYIEISHCKTGFGLCHSRNIALQEASGDIVAYLDDDNQLAPSFSADTKMFFKQQPSVRCLIPKQIRRRNIVGHGQLLKKGKSFVSPEPNTTIWDFVVQKALFDSNGFTHYKDNAPQWNLGFKIFCDYEYFLSCLNQWGMKSFSIASNANVFYTQTSEGIIGQSTYQEWADELSRICDYSFNYSAINEEVLTTLKAVVTRWRRKQTQHNSIAAFSSQKVR